MRLLATTVLIFCPFSTIAQYFYATDAASKVGSWQAQPSGESFSGFLAANSTSNGNMSVTFDTSPIDQDGNYSVSVYTPGCVQTNDCDRRGEVSIVGHYVSQTVDGMSTSTRIAQTNNYDKYEQIYLGAVNASGGDFQSSVNLSSIPGSDGVVVAQAIRFQLLRAFESSGSAETGTAAATTQTGTSNASPTIPNVTVTAFADAPSSGLDEGAKIGIGIGVSLGVVLILVVTLLIYLGVKRKQKARVEKGSQHDGSGVDDDSGKAKAQLHGESSHTEMLDTSLRAELPRGPIHTELSGSSSHAELPGTSLAAELPGKSVH
ncbi:MAG: hypothetical protein Q9219_001406 [cf. Caloplaca sp. 3 TL-2023]